MGDKRMHGISNMTNIHMIADGTIKGHKKPTNEANN